MHCPTFLLFVCVTVGTVTAASIRIAPRTQPLYVWQPTIDEPEVITKEEKRGALDDDDGWDAIGQYSYMHDLFYQPGRFKRAILIRSW